ncbi:toxin-antitoxin system YwqK family antitoxin [Taibaiella koreensis]|uniref:hypothetical protein n=1 Tax=Taibaiella koreensis TaxID=1268548 RepID=UPI000E59D7A2|nr:hypothetical protein [Taibaiella koreensis]
MNKPQGVPEQAVWIEQDNEWALGQKNAEGKNIGEWKWWLAPGGHLVCHTFYEGNGKMSYTRFHADGTYSQKGTMDGDKHVGIRYCQGSVNPTTERVMEGVPAGIFRYEMTYDDNGSFISGQYWNKDGDEVSESGNLLNPAKKGTISDKAIFNVDNQEWEEINTNEQGISHGLSKWWRPDGSLLEEHDYDNGLRKYIKKFHPSGNPAQELIHQNGSLLLKSQIHIDEPGTDIPFQGGKKDDRIMKKEYVHDEHGFMIAWKTWDAAGNLLLEEALNMNMKGNVVQTTYDSIEEASEVWNEKGKAYYKALNTYIDQFYIPEHEEIEDLPKEERTDMEKQVIHEISRLNQSGQADKARELFQPAFEPFSDSFWLAFGNEVKKIIAFENHSYAVVKDTVYKLAGNDISLEEGLIFIGASKDKAFIIKCFEDRMEVLNAATYELQFTANYPGDYGVRLMEQYPDLNTAVFKNPKLLSIRDVSLACNNERIILTTLEGTYVISSARASLVFPFHELMEFFINDEDPGTFRLALNYNHTAISVDGRYALFNTQKGKESAKMQTVIITSTADGYQFNHEKIDSAGVYFDFVQMLFHSNGENLLVSRYEIPVQSYWGNGGDTTEVMTLNTSCIEDKHDALLGHITPGDENNDEEGNKEETTGSPISIRTTKLKAVTEYKDHFIIGMSDKYVWIQEINKNTQKYIYVGGEGQFGSVTSIDMNPDQTRLYVATDFGAVLCFSFLPETERGEGIITNMNVKDEKRYLFLNSFEPMAW